MNVDILTVSSKGQIVLPAKIRKKLSINYGDSLAAIAVGDTIMLKPIYVPTEDDFLAAAEETRLWAQNAGLKELDIDKAIKTVRQRNH